MVAEHIPYILFIIVPHQLLSRFWLALNTARATIDQQMFDKVFEVARHILAITNRTLSAITNRTLQRAHERT